MFDRTIGSGTRFRKGVSGNPGGRPRTRVLSEALRAQLGEIKPSDPSGRSYAEVVAANLIEIACGDGRTQVWSLSHHTFYDIPDLRDSVRSLSAMYSF